jgi:hypothetical protein
MNVTVCRLGNILSHLVIPTVDVLPEQQGVVMYVMFGPILYNSNGVDCEEQVTHRLYTEKRL